MGEPIWHRCSELWLFGELTAEMGTVYWQEEQPRGPWLKKRAELRMARPQWEGLA